MPVRTDPRGAYRAGARTKGMAAGMDTARSLALTDLARRIAPEAVRDMQTTHNLASTRIRASVSARRQGDGVELVGRDRPTGLLQYGAKFSRRRGVTVTIRKDGAPIVLEHAFAAIGAGGNRQIFKRDGKSRLPISGQFGPSPAQILRNKERQNRLVKFGGTKMAEEFVRQMERL